MSLIEQLARKREAIVERWIDSIARSYPAGAETLFQRERDPFRNPLVHTVAQSAQEIFGALTDGAEEARLREALDPLLRLRAVQDVSPAQAVGFAFELRGIAREALKGEAAPTAAEWAEFDAQVDRLALLAFEVYSRCRDAVFEIRVNEIKKQAFPYVLERIKEKREESSESSS